MSPMTRSCSTAPAGRRFVAIAVVLGLAVAACGGNKPTKTEKAADLVADKSAQETTTTAPPKMPAPLSGMAVDAALAERPTVSVKVDNSPQGRPQAGLDKADILFEEKVEGGVTRFIAVFQSQDSELVGPIRSLRTTDPSVVSAFGGVFVFSDGVAVSLRRLQGAPVKVVSERGGASPFTYPKGKHRPYATFAATPRLRKEAPDGAKAPAAAFSFLGEGEAFAAAGAVPATRATVNYGGKTTAAFDYDTVTGRWQRSTNGTPHLLTDGTRLAFANVILERVPYRGVGYNDSAKNPVDEAVVVGQGDGIALIAGKQAKIRWSKASAEAMTVFTDEAGAPLKVLAGPTLIALAPTGAPIGVT